ncbi:hypothetical protein, partial [Stenotrophomonas nitritireducens]|uniref:hypothetical protein n=1 Tax=Stenotrophomonas nitritireducens TaxID=83617 RepID=UPI0013799369
TFLSVRQVLARLNTAWGTQPHANYPGTLNGQIVKALKKGKERAKNLSDQRLISQCSRAITAAKNLANLMASSYAIRVVADYYPEIPIDFTHADRFALNNVDITEAHHWPEKAKAWAKEIEDAWRQLDA